jgi:Tol biopolymer transport system component
MSRIFFLGFVLGVVTVLATCSPSRFLASYPEPMPDSVSISFLPGIVSTDSNEFNAAFSPDGRSFYFTRLVKKRTRIMVTHFKEERWTTPEVIPIFVDPYSDADPAFGPDGKLYFISTRPKDATDTLKDYDIWFTTPLNETEWTEPRNLAAVNSDSSEYYISFAGNGSLYFASARAGGFGQEDIYSSSRVGNTYSAPHNLGFAINTDKSEYDPFIFRDESKIIFTSSNRADGFGGGDLYQAEVISGQWQKAVNMGRRFNTAAREYCAYVSPDDLYLFYSSGGDVRWARNDNASDHFRQTSP